METQTEEIIIKNQVIKETKLKKNEYYALMVHGSSVDKNEANKLGYVWNTLRAAYDAGIERPSNAKPYISKNFYARNDLYRGRTIIIQVDNTDGYCLLSQ